MLIVKSFDPIDTGIQIEKWLKGDNPKPSLIFRKQRNATERFKNDFDFYWYDNYGQGLCVILFMSTFLSNYDEISSLG